MPPRLLLGDAGCVSLYSPWKCGLDSRRFPSCLARWSVRCFKRSAILTSTSCAEMLEVAVAGDALCRAETCSTRLPWEALWPWHSVVSPTVTFATLPLAKSTSNPEAIFKISELFIYGDIHCHTHLFCENVLKVATPQPSLL
jgi:hypothetical protein